MKTSSCCFNIELPTSQTWEKMSTKLKFEFEI